MGSRGFLKLSLCTRDLGVIKPIIVIGLVVLFLYQYAHRLDPAIILPGEASSPSREIRQGESIGDVVVIPLHTREATQLSLREVLERRQDECQYLMVYAAECPWCTAVAPTWAGGSSVNVGNASFSVLWVSVGQDMEAAREFMAKYNLQYPSYAVSSIADSRRLRWVKVPSLWLLKGSVIVSTVEATRLDELVPPRPGDCD